jgi:hypothetical protein
VLILELDVKLGGGVGLEAIASIENAIAVPGRGGKEVVRGR